jgi:hypothetical protein
MAERTAVRLRLDTQAVWPLMNQDTCRQLIVEGRETLLDSIPETLHNVAHGA